ncbi:class I SAM-dependent methyltransferase [Candidatus Kaiserbacteria bacterium]|nr:class I SAM-dependent methyltransferase [Candidatus Kaiserbacteria bacterium]
MDAKAYQYIQKGERSWWYRGREAMVKRMLLGTSLAQDGYILDFGAGYGATYSFLKKYGTVDAYEIEPAAAEGCRARGYARVITTESELGQTDSYTLIGAFDVLEHLEDDRAALRTVYTILESDGVFVATIPAFKSLWSKHDELHHHFRRYSLLEIRRLFTEAGFVQVRASYWNMMLFPVAYVLRFFGKGGGEALTPPAFVNWALTKLLCLEATAVPFVSLPFGTGIVIVGKKPHQHSSV